MQPKIQRMTRTEYDAVVVGSGPNGLAAAIALQQKGLSVLLIEGRKEIGGGLASAELTLPGFIHDTCSAIHPMAVGSPFFQELPLKGYGLNFVYPVIDAAHPLDDGNAAILKRSVTETAEKLGDPAYLDLMQGLVKDWPWIFADVMGPLRFPTDRAAMARFGIKALSSATHLARRFSTQEARALWGGMAAHSMLPLSYCATSAIGLVLLLAGHLQGWPIAVGGSYSIAKALGSYFISLGGKIETGLYIKSLEQVPSARAVLFDITPRQLLSIAGHRFSALYRHQLKNYRYGPGVFKIDWALDAPIPFRSTYCRQAGTIHIGNTFEEIAAAEKMVWEGKHPEKPFVLLAQQSLFDDSRAPEGKQTGWAYCHVPNGSGIDMTEAIEMQVERFAPGFRECILARHVITAAEMEELNPNYIGGDIGGGALDLRQLFTRPALRFSPYRSSARGIYICSSSTPPGGGAHGMCGFHAAKRALRDIFKIR
jgi:phytoene dehydrogenase-like protein